jgi:ribosomal protein S18 acetylase RimI-like enzyme
VNPSISFVRAGEDDIPVIRELSGKIWREYYPGIISREQVEYMLEKMYGENALRQEMRSGVVFETVHVGGTAAGYLAYALEEAGKAIRIDKLYLLKEFRGRGVGRGMLERVRQEAERLDAAEIHLRVNKHNALAIAVYEKYGFLKSGELVQDIGGGFVMDDYVMRFRRI